MMDSCVNETELTDSWKKSQVRVCQLESNQHYGNLVDLIGRNRFRSPVIQADVVKMFYNASVGRYVTQDSYLSNACDFSRGLCIDAASVSTSSHLGEGSGGGVQFMGSLKTRSVSIIDFRRSFLPSDQHDAPIALDGPTQVCARKINDPPPKVAFTALLCSLREFISLFKEVRLPLRT